MGRKEAVAIPYHRDHMTHLIVTMLPLALGERKAMTKEGYRERAIEW